MTVRLNRIIVMCVIVSAPPGPPPSCLALAEPVPYSPFLVVALAMLAALAVNCAERLTGSSP